MKKEFLILLFSFIGVHYQYAMDQNKKSTPTCYRLFSDENESEAVKEEKNNCDESIIYDSENIPSLKDMATKRLAKHIYNTKELLNKENPFVKELPIELINLTCKHLINVSNVTQKIQEKLLSLIFTMQGILLHHKIISSLHGTYIMVPLKIQGSGKTIVGKIVDTISKKNITSINNPEYVLFSPQEKFVFFTQKDNPSTLQVYDLTANKIQQIPGKFKKIDKNNFTGCTYCVDNNEQPYIYLFDLDKRDSNKILLNVSSEPEMVFISDNRKYIGAFINKELLIWHNKKLIIKKSFSPDEENLGTQRKYFYLGNNYFVCPADDGTLHALSYNDELLPLYSDNSDNLDESSNVFKKIKRSHPSNYKIIPFPTTYFVQSNNQTIHFKGTGEPIKSYNSDNIGIDYENNLLIKKVGDKTKKQFLLLYDVETYEEKGKFEITKEDKKYFKSNRRYEKLPPVTVDGASWKLWNLETGLNIKVPSRAKREPIYSENKSHMLYSQGINATNTAISHTGIELPIILRKLDFEQLRAVIKQVDNQQCNEAEDKQELNEKEIKLLEEVFSQFPILSPYRLSLTKN